MEPMGYGLLLALTLTGLGLLFWLVRQNRLLIPLRRRAEQIDALAGVGQAILGAQLKLDALCEVVYQQASQIMDTNNFQLGLFDGDDYIIKIWLRDGERLPGEHFPQAGSEGLIGWMRRTGQELLIGDYQAEWERLPAKPRYEASQPARSAVFAPLVTGGDPIGVIAVQSSTPHAFSAADLRLLMVLANQAAGAIRNAQLFEQSQARTRQLQLVSEVGRQVTSMQPLYDLFRQVVSLVQHTFGYYAVSIFTLDDKAGRLRLVASSHADFRELDIPLTTGEGLVEWAAVHARTALAADVMKDTRYLADARFANTRSEVAVPLMIERRVVGVLDVQSDEVGTFTHDDVTVLEALATQIALAVQEAQTYGAERRQRERLNALTEASRAVVSILNLDDLLEEVVDLATDYFGFDRTHIFLREGEQVVFRAGSGVHSGRWAIEQLAYDLDGPGLIAKVSRTGLPVIVNDVADHDDYTPGPGVEDTRSEMVIPIRMSRQTLGVLDIQSAQPDAFSSDDAELAEALSDTVAIALRNATLYAREKRRRILAESLREVSTGLGASLEVDSVLNGVLQGLERVIPVDAAVIVLYDEDAESYRISATYGKVNEQVQGTLLPLDADIPQEMTRIFHPQADEVEATPEAHNPPFRDHEHLLIPLLLGDDPIGYLAIDHHAGRFTLDDMEIINAFATQSAIAIANAQLYMAQREEAWISTALLQVAEATARAANLDDVLQTVARITPLLVGVEWCSVLLREADGFRVVEIEGVPPEVADILVGHTVTPDEWPPLADLMQHGEPVLLMREPVPLPEQIGRDVRIDQGVMLPLYAKGEVMGTLLIGQQDQAEILSMRKVELVGGIANQAALAIESAQLYIAQQEEAWITTALLQVAEAVNAQLELTSTLQTVVRLTPLLVGVERCGVLRWDNTTSQFYGGISYGCTPEAETAFAQTTLSPDTHPYLAALRQATTPLDAGEGTPYTVPAQLAAIFAADELLGLPLIAQGRLNGVMLVNHPADGLGIDRRQMNILTGIASQTALAIETSHLQAAVAERQQLERELEVAKDIQNSFLPDATPSVPGWEVAAYYRAARMVGGDFYDFIRLPDDTWGLVVADVADKGIPAALYMALTRTLLRAVARNRTDPAATLLRVNELLRTDTHSDLFVTMWYAIWDPADGSLHYASAGHNPPLVINANGAPTQKLRLKGIALGVLDNIALESAQITLAPGDTLVMYTDGITEAYDADTVEFDVAGLETVTRRYCAQPASAILRGIIEALDQHTGIEPQFDDLTLVVVRRTAAG